MDKNQVSKEQLEKDAIYNEQKAIETDRRRKSMTLGHICCSLGHRLIYEEFLKTKHERVMIFEDDVTVLPNNEDKLDEVLNAFPEDAEMIYWGWTATPRPPWWTLKQKLYHLQHSLGLLSYNHTMINNLYPKPFNDHFSIAGKQFCAHAYTLTRTAAQKLIDWQTPIILNADNAILYAVLNEDIKAYISHTQIFSQSSLDENSDIESLTQS